MTCLSNIKQGKVPQFAIENGMGFPWKPEQLEIAEMEERLICPRIPFMQIYGKPRGHIVNVPTDEN